VLALALLLQNLVFIADEAHAVDLDGSSNVELFLTPSLPESSIIGENFTLDIALKNQPSSEWDGYRPWIILSLPTGVSLVSAGTLGSPTRTISHASGSTLVFFATTNDVVIAGMTTHYPITLASSNTAWVFINQDIWVLAYVDDSIYGRGAVPSGAPGGTLPGGVDWASWSGVSMADTTDMSFPDNVIATTPLATLPFITPATEFTPFDITKEESTMNLIGKGVVTTLTIHGNTMGTLRHFHLQDIIPMNRAFSGFITPVGGSIWGLNVTYNSPSPGLATLDITDITVPTWTDTTIQYETIPLAYDMSSYSAGIPVLASGSVIPHHDLSRNTVTMHTGGLALVGGPHPVTTWNNGVSDIVVNSSSILPPRSVDAYNRYANLSKWANVSQGEIGDTITYTLTLDTAKNASFTTNGTGTFITDILPDGMTYSGMMSSTVTSGTPFTFISANTNIDGDTTITWRLNTGIIDADARATIVYQAVIDGIYEGAWDTEYENTETLVNTASFRGTVGDGGLSGIWGITDPSIVDTLISIDNVSATISAPVPTTKKHLISVTTPDATIYDYSTGLPSYIPAGSKLRFAVTMDFPQVNFINPKLIDALPLLAGPNIGAYDFAFQTNATLRDIENTLVAFNTEDGATTANTFNSLALSGTIYPNASWIAATPGNNLEFSLGTGVGEKTFALLFTVDVLAKKPSGGVSYPGLVPLRNFAYSSFQDDTLTPNMLPIMTVPFAINMPHIAATKSASGATDIEAGKDIEYNIRLNNDGSAPGYIDTLIDTLPADMTLISGYARTLGAVSNLPNTSITQSGNVLSINFNTGWLGWPRSYIPLDNSGTPTISENIVDITYTVRPTTNFVIAGWATRTNIANTYYYASSWATADAVHRLGLIWVSTGVTVKSPTLTRSILATTEVDSPTDTLYVGEEVTYRSIITVPNGTYNLANYTETINQNLQFLSGMVVASSGSLSFSSGTTFSWTTVNFGTLINSDTTSSTLETIIIDTTYRVRQAALPGSNYTNNATFNYSATSIGSPLYVNVRKPNLTLSKVATPTVGQYGTIVSYTVTVSNTSANANAYDINIADVLPSKLQYVTGSLVLGSFSGTESDLFGSWLFLASLGTLTGASFSFQATPVVSVGPTENLINNVSGWYSTLDDDESPHEATGALSANANFSISDIVIAHTLVSTDLADTTNTLFSGALADLAIGERASYDTVITIPEASFTGFTITQTLPVGMKFLSGSILIDGVKTHALSLVTISPDNVIIFSLGDVDNTGIWAWSGVTLRTEAVLQDHGANLAGTSKDSNITVSYGSLMKNAGPVSIDVVEPVLSVTKLYSPNSGDAGDIIATTVTVENTSPVTAYDVVLTDIPATKTTPDGGYSGSIVIGTLAPGAIRTYNYNTSINTNVSPWENLTGTASIIYTSYPGNPTEGERNYGASDTDVISIINSGAVIITRISAEETKIGDTVHYEIRVPVSEGSTSSIDVANLLPTGMALIPTSVVITTSSGLSYSGTVVPGVSPSSPTITAGQTQTVSYAFTDIINTDTNNGNTEYLIINYDALLLNSVDTNNLSTKTHSVSADYNGGAIIKNALSLPITIIEPHLVLAVSHSYTDGYTVPYMFTLTNTGNATAYDIDLATLMPTLISYTGSINLINSGGSIGLTRVGDTFTLTSLPVNTGNPLVFTINGHADESLANATTHTLTGTVTYTSQPGGYTQSIANVLNSERTSAGGVNDYRDPDKTTSFILALALLDEAISVDKSVGIIGDIFEYTITLTNTGSVPLSSIPVSLDIPWGFTGFTIMSTPAGSTNISTLTGGAADAGYLSVTGISLPVGQTRTIVYRVTALPSVLPGTIIPTMATVGDSLEWARGGTPAVPVRVDAPHLISTAVETDTNSNLLYDGETLRHTFTLSNTGTATGTNVQVTISWNTGSTLTGNLLFQTGTLISTGSVVIDTIQNTITFTIPALPVSAAETIEFYSVAHGPAGTSIRGQISAIAYEGVMTDTLSNILTIVAPPSSTWPGSGGGGGGGSISAGYTVSAPIEKTLSPIISRDIPVITREQKPQIPLRETLEIEKMYEEYLAKVLRYQLLAHEEQTAWVLGIKYPKVLPQTGKNILERVKKYFSPKLSVDVPTFSIGDTTLRSYLSNLPETDRNRDEYIVLPSNGMITPINSVPENTSDYTKLVSGREINVNTHLKTGVMTYPGTNNGGYGSIGNTVIFGHSSYFASDDGRYKTHFQKIIELEAGEEVWVFQKRSNGEYQKYRYIVESSYDTKSTDTSVLSAGVGKNLTLFTCTPIGGIAGRWIVKAKYIDEEKQTLEKVLYGNSMTATEKKTIDTFFQSLRKKSASAQRLLILSQYDRVAQDERTVGNTYFLYKLAKAYNQVKNAE
jgi:uncharacterized repeat protein (TIGR01451 family)